VVRSRYDAWDGSQDPLGERVDVADVLDQLADDLLMGAGGRSALRDLQHRGAPGRRGLDDLRRAVAARREQLQRDLAGGPLDALREELDQVVATEREALA
jgi:uncharacterized protein with von Willebrand factor type A (vWA) domain